MDVDASLLADSVGIVPEDHTGQEIVILHAELERRFHTGRHGTEDRGLERTLRLDIDGLRTDAQHEVAVCEDRILEDGAVLFDDLRYGT